MTNVKKILVTGGLGYIGSHTIVELYKNGYEAIIVDNLCNSSIITLEYLKQLTNNEISFYNIDITQNLDLDKLFTTINDIHAVIHFAALKSVPESVTFPELYFQNNINGLVNVLQCCKKYKISNFIFSSTATVYPQDLVPPHAEHQSDYAQYIDHAYGQTKLLGESILKDLSSRSNLKSLALRYYNPIGAHESGLLSDNPKGVPNNLMPYIVQVAQGKLAELTIFGNDYPTKDGTCLRDYIHVCDLAQAHVVAIDHLTKQQDASYFNAINIGTGKAYSVLEIVHAFESAWGKPIPFVIGKRRSGDVAMLQADVSKAKNIMQWQAKYNLANMMDSIVNYIVSNKS